MDQVAIKNNVLGGNQPCALCGDMVSTHFGPELFVEGSMQIVCRGCGHDHAPGLAELLDLMDGALTYTERSQD
jgi:hypothetical protein